MQSWVEKWCLASFYERILYILCAVIGWKKYNIFFPDNLPAKKSYFWLHNLTWQMIYLLSNTLFTIFRRPTQYLIIKINWILLFHMVDLCFWLALLSLRQFNKENTFLSNLVNASDLNNRVKYQTKAERLLH